MLLLLLSLFPLLTLPLLIEFTNSHSPFIFNPLTHKHTQKHTHTHTHTHSGALVPKQFEQYTVSASASALSAEDLAADDDTELWLVRVPAKVGLSICLCVYVCVCVCGVCMCVHV